VLLCCLAHGSNDVGNAIAPLAITYIYRTGSSLKWPPPSPLDSWRWIVTGLAIWGKKVIATIGKALFPPTQCGFCAELATATTILVASRLGLPVSTSHARRRRCWDWSSPKYQVNSIQNRSGIAWAWLITIPISAGLGASITVVHLLSSSQCFCIENFWLRGCLKSIKYGQCSGVTSNSALSAILCFSNSVFVNTLDLLPCCDNSDRNSESTIVNDSSSSLVELLEQRGH